MEKRKIWKYWAVAALLLGCTEASVSNPADGNNVDCADDQVYFSGACYDACSALEPCADASKKCSNGRCIDANYACTPDTRICSSDQKNVFYCADGSGYTQEKSCESDEICENGICLAAACQTGQKRCNANHVEICKNNSYTIYTECSEEQTCNETEFVCEKAAQCQNGLKRCGDTGNIEICRNNQWESYEACGTGKVCDDASYTCVIDESCTSGTKCADNDVYECTDGRWQLKESCGTLGCSDATCRTSECTDNETSCEEINGVPYVKTCTGGAYDYDPCKSNESCVVESGVAQCVENPCSTGTYQCSNNSLQKCDEGGYTTVQTCTSDEYCDVGSASCKPNCGNGKLDGSEDCDGSSIKTGLTCEKYMTGTVGELKCTASCTIDASACATSCDEEATATCENNIYKQCTNGLWVSQPCTDTQSCSATKGCYTPTSGYDYTMDFESVTTKNITSYTDTTTYTDGDVTWSIKAHLVKKETGVIDGSWSPVIKAGKGSEIKATFATAVSLGNFEFKWRSWGGSSDEGNIVVKVNDAQTDTVTVSKDDTTPTTYQKSLNTTVTSITITTDGSGTGRFYIDDISWTYNK